MTVIVWLIGTTLVTSIARAQEAVLIGFDDISSFKALSTENWMLEGATFEGASLVPVDARSSSGIPFELGTSGGTQVRSEGSTTIRFDLPVVRVGLKVYNERPWVTLGRDHGYHTIYLQGYSDNGELVASANTRIVVGLAEPEELRNISAATLSAISPVPIRYVVLDNNDPVGHRGVPFYFDDLEVRVVPQGEPESPVLAIEEIHSGIFAISWGPIPGILQVSNDFSNWTNLMETRGYHYTYSAKSLDGLFFRVVR